MPKSMARVQFHVPWGLEHVNDRGSDEQIPDRLFCCCASLDMASYKVTQSVEDGNWRIVADMVYDNSGTTSHGWWGDAAGLEAFWISLYVLLIPFVVHNLGGQVDVVFFHAATDTHAHVVE